MQVNSDLRMDTPVPVTMPAMRWVMLLGALDVLAGTDEAVYLSEFFDEIIAALGSAERAVIDAKSQA